MQASAEPKSQKTQIVLDQVLSPIYQRAKQLDISDEELDGAIDQARQEAWEEHIGQRAVK